ncbi:AI-2E family transporter [Roseibium alexandrii]|uniref:Putative inner membrane protein n=1 Tax=Roseibium alexandrii TaxID=388408 RepID=A0A0M7AQ61_9HYPH|nr:AI-2E family transporter [Roseibium alexandrii]CTQ76651.1 putative inner membrane protein [Roseibium alexandrii]
MTTNSQGENGPQVTKLRFQMFLIGFAALAIAAAFLGLIWDYLIALFMAAVISILAAPLFQRIVTLVGERKNLAVALTLLCLAVGVLLPLVIIIVLSAHQAASVASNLTNWAKTVDLEILQGSLPEWIPFKVDFAQIGAWIVTKITEAAGQIADFFVSILSQATKGTVSFFLNLFIMVYALVFFLPQEPNVFRQLLSHSALPNSVQQQLSDRVVSISRATIKGTFLIGAAQGFLGGFGFWMAGLNGAAFWGCVMAVFSIIPGIGPGLVIFPGVVYLAINGDFVAALGLTIWTVLVVTTVDNFLRPVLVGRDTKMPDLLVLISTFGGLAAFGAVGLIIGPVIAGLFLTIWAVLEEYLHSDGLADAPALEEIKTASGEKANEAVSQEIQDLRKELDVPRQDRQGQ